MNSNKNVKQYFKDYPTAVECFSTSDGFIFHHQNNALNHANTLADKAVESHKRESEKESGNSSETDLNKMKLVDLKALCAEKGIDAESFTKKAECIEALEALKAAGTEEEETEE